MEKLLKIVFRILLLLKGYRVRRVFSKEEESKVIQFSDKILATEGYPEEYLKMLEKYYINSELFVVYHKNKLIGSMRLYAPSGPCRILDFWNVKFPSQVPLSKFREMGSLVIDKAHRGKSRWAMTALLDIAYTYSKKIGVNWWFASAFVPKYEKFKRMHPSCRVLNPAEPTEHQKQYREQYSDFFEEAKRAILFEFDLREASYLHQFKRMLRRKKRQRSRGYDYRMVTYAFKRGF